MECFSKYKLDVEIFHVKLILCFVVNTKMRDFHFTFTILVLKHYLLL